MNTDYQEYAREFVSRWARKIAARAGCEHGKGGRGKKIRGKKISLRARLFEEMTVEARTWERYEAGTMWPRPANMHRIHELAKHKGYLGHRSAGGLLARLRDAEPMMSEDEFEYWDEQRQRELGISDADHVLAQRDAWLWSLDRPAQLKQQAAALLREAARIQSAHGQV